MFSDIFLSSTLLILLKVGLYSPTDQDLARFLGAIVVDLHKSLSVCST